jgi:hypothetical protein
MREPQRLVDVSACNPTLAKHTRRLQIAHRTYPPVNEWSFVEPVRHGILNQFPNAVHI